MTQVSANSQQRLTPYQLQKKISNLNQNQNFESDSVNENFSPLRSGIRRKRKMKRMDANNADNQMIPPKAINGLIGKSNLMIGLVRRSYMPVAGPSGIKNAKKKKIIKNFTASNNERLNLLFTS